VKITGREYSASPAIFSVLLNSVSKNAKVKGTKLFCALNVGIFAY